MAKSGFSISRRYVDVNMTVRTDRSGEEVLDVFFELVGVGAAVYEDLLYTSTGEELEGVFDERSVCQW